MTRRQRKIAARRAAPVAAVPKAEKGVTVTLDALLAMRAKSRTNTATPADIFKPYVPMRGVLPTNVSAPRLAMDAGFDANAAAGMGVLEGANAAFGDGYAFPGFATLSNWAQIPEFRRPAEVFAREMTRKWIKIQASGDIDKSDKVKKLTAEFKRLNVQATFREAIQQDGQFGRSQIFIDTGVPLDRQNTDELKIELTESKAKVGIGGIKRLAVIEPIWSYPNRYNADNPLDPTFYKPTSWFVMGTEVHSSRLLTIITRDVPDILKPAYAFSGLSLAQMMKPYVDNWLRTRQSVSDLVHAFTVWTLKTDMSQIMNAEGMSNFFNRLRMFNLARDNHGVNAIGTAEEFDNTSVPLGGLDKLQAQSQEQMSAPSGLPLVYLTGITPAGLNASSQDEIEVFQDSASANQEIYTPSVSKILNLVQLSLFGEIDPEIGFVWNPLKVIRPVDKATIRKMEAETDQIDIESGVLLPEERRKRVADDEDSPYRGLSLAQQLPEPVTSGGQPGPNEEGLDLVENQQPAENEHETAGAG